GSSSPTTTPRASTARASTRARASPSTFWRPGSKCRRCPERPGGPGCSHTYTRDPRHPMTRAHAAPDALVWHHGMLLAPQHFQQLSRRHEMLLYYHARTVAPYHWGVRHLEFDRVMLVGGVLRVRELEAILPDGLVVSHAGGPDRADLQLDLAPFAERLKDQAL